MTSSSPAGSSPAGLAPSPRRFLNLQALDDAIAHRQARISGPCPDCGPGPDAPRCDEHACDQMLIAAYREAAQAAVAEIENARGSAGDLR
jgi:hypothetical protein